MLHLFRHGTGPQVRPRHLTEHLQLVQTVGDRQNFSLIFLQLWPADMILLPPQFGIGIQLLWLQGFPFCQRVLLRQRNPRGKTHQFFPN